MSDLPSAIDLTHEIQPCIQLDSATTLRFFHNKSHTTVSTNPSDPTYYSIMTHTPSSDTPVFILPPHWHAKHDEWWTVLSGEIIQVLDGTDHLTGPDQGPREIKRGVTHGVRTLPGQSVTLREATWPAGPFKEAFVRDMFQFGRQPGFLHAMRAFLDADTWPSFGMKWVDRSFMMGITPLARLAGPANPNDINTRQVPEEVGEMKLEGQK